MLPQGIKMKFYLLILSLWLSFLILSFSIKYPFYNTFINFILVIFVSLSSIISLFLLERAGVKLLDNFGAGIMRLMAMDSPLRLALIISFSKSIWDAIYYPLEFQSNNDPILHSIFIPITLIGIALEGKYDKIFYISIPTWIISLLYIAWDFSQAQALEYLRIVMAAWILLISILGYESFPGKGKYVAFLTPYFMYNILLLYYVGEETPHLLYVELSDFLLGLALLYLTLIAYKRSRNMLSALLYFVFLATLSTL